LEKLESEIESLRKRMESNTRRIEELEATAFTLRDEEEVVLVAVPRKSDQAAGKPPRYLIQRYVIKDIYIGGHLGVL
jgi:hypothetical protein